jgi:hypothetical protein
LPSRHTAPVHARIEPSAARAIREKESGMDEPRETDMANRTNGGRSTQLGDWQLTPGRVLLLLSVLCFVLALFGGIGNINLIALGLALGFGSFLL